MRKAQGKWVSGWMAWFMFVSVLLSAPVWNGSTVHAAATAYLSDLNWTSATIGYGTVRKDKSVDGNTITLNGTTYAKGIGTHAASEIKYALGGGYSRFTSDVGVDDEQNSYGGTVTFEVWADGTKLYDSGVMNNTTATKSIDVSVAGKNELRLVVTDAGDGIGSDHADWAGARLIGSGSGTGLKGEYFDNSDLTNLKVTRTDATVNFNWQNGSPDTSIASDTFSARWTGQVEPTATETYTFYTNTDDGVRLWVNNQLLVNKWQDQAATEWSGSIALTAGQKYDIKMEYYENGGGASAQLLWSSPSRTKEVIPQSQLYPSTSSSTSSDRYIGINIEHPSDSSNLKIFANAYKTVRLGSPNNPSDNSVPVDGNSDPTKDFGIFLWDAGGFIADTQGSYAISFNGQADVSVTMGDASIPGGITYNSSTNTSTGTMVVNTNSSVQLKFVNTKRTASSALNTGITNIKIMRPVSPGSTTSYSPSTLFTDTFQNIIKNDFKANGIRFMDFTSTNGKTAEVQWADRVRPSMPQQSSGSGYGWQGRGASWEYAILLCNTLGVDAWINVPVAVSDDYITKLAQLFKYGSDGTNPYTSTQTNPVYPPLNPNLKLFVEYSNELWNTASAFSQTHWNKDKAVAEVNAGGSNLNYDGTTNEWTLAWRRTAKRTVEISNIFRGVFGDSDMMTRVRPVLEWQQGNGQATASTMLTFIDNWYGNRDGNHVTTPRPVNYYIWGGSGSAYYNPDNSSDSLTLSNIWSSESMDPANWAGNQTIDASWAAMFGLKRTAYEGGPSLDNTGHSESIKEQAWNDSRMATEIVEHQKAWENYGGDMLFYFTFAGMRNTGYYQWEYVKDMNNPRNTSPKLQGIYSLNGGAKEPVTIGTAVSSSVNGNGWSLNNRGWGSPGSGSVTLHTQPDQWGSAPIQWASYTFRSSAAGSFTASVSYSSSNAAEVEVYVDGTYVGKITTSGTSGSTVTYNAPAISLGSGLHAVRLYCKSGPISISSVSLQ